MTRAKKPSRQASSKSGGSTHGSTHGSTKSEGPPTDRVTLSVEIGGPLGRLLADRIAEAVRLACAPAAPQLLSEVDAAKQLGHSTQWLRKQRRDKRGPGVLARKIGGQFFYAAADLAKWIAEQPGGNRHRR